MSFTQRTRGIVRAIAIVLSLAVPLVMAISAADARNRWRRQFGLAGNADVLCAAEHLHGAGYGATL